MDTKLFFSKCDELYQNLQKLLTDIEYTFKTDKIALHERSLMEIDDIIRELKALTVDFTFTNLADEVYFFKKLKPLFISRFIYHTKLLSIEAAKPNAGKNVLKDYYEYEIEGLKNFYEQNIEFYEYYRRRAAYLDFKYFVRNQFDVKTRIESSLYDLDEKFRTSHDHLVSHILANDKLEVYLLGAVADIEEHIHEKITSQNTGLIWTSSKSSLVELLYALHLSKSFNGGNVEFGEIIKAVEAVLKIDLGNFYKTVSEIKNRKMTKNKFLQLLSDNLINEVEE